MGVESYTGRKAAADPPAAEAPPRTFDVTVLRGGPGSEREVSLMSGRAVAEALARAGHRVTAADIHPDDVGALDREDLEVVFIALHGEFGENGRVQELCEARGLTYVGSGPAASELAMDKHLSKQVFRQAGVLTPDWAVVGADDGSARRRRALAAVPPACVVKPVDSGSSVDVTIARDAEARDAALAGVLDRYGRAMVEAFVDGRELTVGVLAERPLPVIEIIPREAFYNYVAKYEDDGTRYVADPDLPAGVREALPAAALKVHRALGCRDLSRVDFILDAQGRPWALEANTIPGFTSHSLVPKAAAAAGIDFASLCDRLVRLAADRGR